MIAVCVSVIELFVKITTTDITDKSRYIAL